MLAKTLAPTTVGEFRSIALFSIFLKLQDAVLLRRIDGDLCDSWPAETFGFKKGCQCADFIHALSLMSQRAREWKKAFDRTSWSGVRECLRERRPNHHAEVDALVREHAGTEMTMTLGGITTECARHRGVLQG